jgi:PAS domain S-box-containing protein
MAMRLKTKLSLGLAFLFTVILFFGILGLATINRLSQDADQVLKNNQESLQYCNKMMAALEDISVRRDAMAAFEEYLRRQEGNITEVGEREVTQELRKNFNELKVNPTDPSNYSEIRRSLIQIQDLNEMAILRKSTAAQNTAANARFWLTVIFTFLSLLAFTFIFNLPGIISNPVASLSEGIREIANKNYKKRIHLRQQDEFGELAGSFNFMAAKLDEYENSNLSQIKFEKSRIETIINQMRDGIIGLDDKKHILFLNAVAEKLLGLKEKDIVGKYAPDVAVHNDLMRTLLQDQQEQELKIFADRKESYFSRDVLKVTNNELVIGEVIILRNITFFHELNEAKTNFIATVSHELKTPISSIKMSAQLLMDERIGSLSGDQRELIASIRDDADRLLKMTGELLNMTQVETGNIQLKLQPTPPGIIAGQALQAVQFQAQQKNISLNKHFADSLPNVFADPEKTVWVLVNLLTNAIKYSPEGTQIDFSIAPEERLIAFRVVDHGRGIDEKYLPRIFDRYFKVPGSYERNGTGLGLAISKEFIEAQGGAIWVQSQVGMGSEFGFTLASA